MNKKLKLEIGCYLDMSIRDNRNVLRFLHDLLNDSLTIQLAIKCNKTKALLLEIGKFISSTNKELNEIYRNSNIDSDLDGELESIADELITEALDILNAYTPDYTYLGFSDGSFGLWCSIENIDHDFEGLVKESNDLSCIDTNYVGHVLYLDSKYHSPQALYYKKHNTDTLDIIWSI